VLFVAMTQNKRRAASSCTQIMLDHIDGFVSSTTCNELKLAIQYIIHAIFSFYTSASSVLLLQRGSRSCHHARIETLHVLFVGGNLTLANWTLPLLRPSLIDVRLTTASSLVHGSCRETLIAIGLPQVIAASV